MYLEKTTINSFLKALSGSGKSDLAANVSPDLLEELSKYLGFLHRWNKKMNLTRIFSSPEFLRDEFLTSPAFYSSAISSPNVKRVLDIGSGNGIPAIFCALMYSEKNFTLCEIDYKKTVFLQELKRFLGISNITVINNDYKNAQTADGMGYDVIMFKNVSKQSHFLESAGRLLTSDGRIVFQTSMKEVDSLDNKNASFDVVRTYNIPVEKPTCLVELSIVPRETI